MKYFYNILLLLSLLFLNGCFGNSETLKEISFDNFGLKINKSFEIVNGENIENKQINNKILKAYKIDSENNFKENILITHTKIKKDISLETFAKANIKKLSNNIVGTKNLGMEKIFYDCNEKEKKGIISNYHINYDIGNKENNATNIYVSQIYIKQGNTGYIISYTNNEPVKEKFKNYMNTLKCN